MNVFLQQFINGLNSGSIYALIAIGYTLVYGILKLINFVSAAIHQRVEFRKYIRIDCHRLYVGLRHPEAD